MRPSWDEYFLQLAELCATRATCPRRHVGAVLVKDKRIKATGYNGSPTGQKHCDDIGCLMIDGHCERTIHAEANVLLEASPADCLNATLYITDLPCRECARLLAGSGIRKVVYRRDYRAEDGEGSSRWFLEQSKVQVKQIGTPSSPQPIQPTRRNWNFKTIRRQGR